MAATMRSATAQCATGRPALALPRALTTTRAAMRAVAGSCRLAMPVQRVGGRRMPAASRRGMRVLAAAIRDGAAIEGRKLRVAIIGGGPSGACAAEVRPPHADRSGLA
jgi:hypothetical protein